jgi:MFS family permease
VQAGQILAAAVFLPLAHYMPKETFNTWGWRIPFLLSIVVIIAGYIIRRAVDETPAFAEEGEHGEIPKSPILEAFRLSWADMLRVVCMALMNVIPVVATIFGGAYAVQAAYGIGLPADVYLWIPVLGNILAVIVIPFVGNLSDKIGRRPPVIVGALGAGLLSFGYLYAISIHSVPLAIALSLLMWGVIYQGYNAIFPSFYPELFQTRTRVSAMAIAQNVGTTITAMLPALFAVVAPPGSANIPLTVGALAFGITIISAVAAMTARETYRIHLNDLVLCIHDFPVLRPSIWAGRNVLARLAAKLRRLGRPNAFPRAERLPRGCARPAWPWPVQPSLIRERHERLCRRSCGRHRGDGSQGSYAGGPLHRRRSRSL